MPLAIPAGSQLTVRSRLFPDLVIPVGASAGGGGLTGAAVLKAVQPAVTVTIGGEDLYTFAPAGVPSSQALGWGVAVGGLLVVSLALYGFIQLVRRTRGNR